MSMTVTSNVPPPKSLTIIRWSGDDASDSSAIAAAVGSLMTRITSNHAISVPASSPAHWKRVKYVRTLMTSLIFASVS